MCSITWLFFSFAGVRRMWMNVPQTRVWMEASVSTTWTALSVCVIWITQGYTAKWMSATSTCMSSWVCGKISSSWCPTSWSVLTMSQKLSGVSRSTIRPLPVHYDCAGLNSGSEGKKKSVNILYLYIYFFFLIPFNAQTDVMVCYLAAHCDTSHQRSQS